MTVYWRKEKYLMTQTCFQNKKLMNTLSPRTTKNRNRRVLKIAKMIIWVKREPLTKVMTQMMKVADQQVVPTRRTWVKVSMDKLIQMKTKSKIFTS